MNSNANINRLPNLRMFPMERLKEDLHSILQLKEIKFTNEIEIKQDLTTKIAKCLSPSDVEYVLFWLKSKLDEINPETMEKTISEISSLRAIHIKLIRQFAIHKIYLRILNNPGNHKYYYKDEKLVSLLHKVIYKLSEYIFDKKDTELENRIENIIGSVIDCPSHAELLSLFSLANTEDNFSYINQLSESLEFFKMILEIRKLILSEEDTSITESKKQQEPKRQIENARVHPLFPTVKEVKAKEAGFYSDHLPILLKGGETQETSPVLLTFNVLGDLGCSGLHPSITEYNEDKETRRYEDIAKRLALISTIHNIDVIGLQEVPKFIRGMLDKSFDNGAGVNPQWQVCLPIDKNKRELNVGVITCYNTQKYDLVENTYCYENRIHTLKLRDKTSNEIIYINNVWGIYTPFSFEQQKKFETFLNKQRQESIARNKNAKFIIFGDTNSRIAPVDNTPRNITTGVVPTMLNFSNGVYELDYQVPDHPDGGFSCDSNGAITQMTNEVISLKTGEIFQNNLKKEEISYWPQYRMILTLDHHYQTTPYIKDQTIFDYQKSINENILINALNFKLQVGMAATCHNEKAIAIACEKNESGMAFYAILQKLLASHPEFKFDEITSEAKTMLGLFAPITQDNTLDSALSRAISILTLDQYMKKLVVLYHATGDIKGQNFYKEWYQKAHDCKIKFFNNSPKANLDFNLLKMRLSNIQEKKQDVAGLCTFSLSPDGKLDTFQISDITFPKISMTENNGSTRMVGMLGKMKLLSTTAQQKPKPKRFVFKYNEQDTLSKHPRREKNEKVEVLHEECTNAAIKETRINNSLGRRHRHQQQNIPRKVAILNMANEETIGGGAFGNAEAQEEYLFRVSDLSPGLLGYSAGNNNGYPAYFKFGRPYYGAGSFNATDVIYSQNKIYRGKSVREKDKFQFRYEDLKQPVDVNFITSAALYRNPDTNRFTEMIAGQRHECDSFTADALHAAKIYNQIKTAIENGNDTLILGAFGCGAFHNDPEKMAELYRDILSLPEFIGRIKIKFAITDKRLVDVFQKKFNDKLSDKVNDRTQLLKKKLRFIHEFENHPAVKKIFAELVQLNNQILPNQHNANPHLVAARDNLLNRYLKIRDIFKIMYFGMTELFPDEKNNSKSARIEKIARIQNFRQACVDLKHILFDQNGEQKNNSFTRHIKKLPTRSLISKTQAAFVAKREEIFRAHSMLDCMRGVNQYLTRRSKETVTKSWGFGGNDYFARRNSWISILERIINFQNKHGESDNLRRFIQSEADKFKSSCYFFGRNDYYNSLVLLIKSIPTANDTSFSLPITKERADIYLNIYKQNIYKQIESQHPSDLRQSKQSYEMALKKAEDESSDFINEHEIEGVESSNYRYL